MTSRGSEELLWPSGLALERVITELARTSVDGPETDSFGVADVLRAAALKKNEQGGCCRARLPPASDSRVFFNYHTSHGYIRIAGFKGGVQVRARREAAFGEWPFMVVASPCRFSFIAG